jgi:hypothetical protein
LTFESHEQGRRATRGAFWRVEVEGDRAKLGLAKLVGQEGLPPPAVYGAPRSNTCTVHTPRGRCGRPAYRIGGTPGHRLSVCDLHFWQEQDEGLRPSKWLGKRPKLRKRPVCA